MINPLYNRLIFVFSLIGLLIAGYMWYMHAYPADIPCGPSRGCETVANSPYSRFPPGSGPPVAMFGTLGYLAITVLSFLRTQTPEHGGVDRDRRLLALILLGASFGLAASLWLTYVEIFWIKAICKWCMGSQFVMLLLFGTVLTEWIQTGKRKAL
jgi:uncharacterized membrane protein